MSVQVEWVVSIVKVVLLGPCQRERGYADKYKHTNHT